MNDSLTAAAIREMTTEVGVLGERIQGMKEHLGSVSSTVKTIEASTNEIRTEIALIEKRDDQQDERLDVIEAAPSVENGTSVINLKIVKLNREMVILILGLVSLATGGGAWIWSFIK